MNKFLFGLLLLLPRYGESSSESWSLGAGVVRPAHGTALRLNPASAVDQKSLVQLQTRYSVLTGGPLTVLEGVWSATPRWAIGGGVEFSWGTQNPEAHLGLGWSFIKSHGVGLSALVRRELSKTDALFGVYQHSHWTDRLQTAVALQRISRTLQTAELVGGVFFKDLFLKGLSVEHDLAYLVSGRSLVSRPALVGRIFRGLVGSASLDLPLRSLQSSAVLAGLAYETDRWNVHLRAGTTLEAEVGFVLRL